MDLKGKVLVDKSDDLTHFPPWLVERVLELLEPDDARLLAALLNEASAYPVVYFYDGGWRVAEGPGGQRLRWPKAQPRL